MRERIAQWLTKEHINEHFIFDEENGVFFRKNAPGVPIGQISSDGYIYFQHRSTKLGIHRLAFFMKNGFLPKYVDHINGKRADNRPVNLRAVTHRQNMFNRRVQVNSKTGFKGVTQERGGSFTGQVRAAGTRKRKHGFLTAEAAYEWCCEERLKMHQEYCNNHTGRAENFGYAATHPPKVLEENGDLPFELASIKKLRAEIDSLRKQLQETHAQPQDVNVELLKAAKKWWESYRPIDYSKEDHLSNPDVNISSDDHIQLALLVAKLIQHAEAQAKESS